MNPLVLAVHWLLNYWRSSYFTNVLPPLMAWLAIFLLFRRKERSARLFLAYFLAYSASQLVFFLGVAFYTHTPQYHSATEWMKRSDVLFTLFEFWIFYRYIGWQLDRRYRFAQLAVGLVYALGSLAILLRSIPADGWISQNGQTDLYNVQAGCLVLLCLLYYRNLFQRSTCNPVQEPSFWIVSALTLCMITSLPYSLFINEIRRQNYLLYTHLFAIIYILYTLMFGVILRAQYMGLAGSGSRPGKEARSAKGRPLVNS